MKLVLFKILLLTLLTSLTLSIPINTEKEVNKNVKRYDINTYISSVGHFFKSSDIKHVRYCGFNSLDVYYSKKDKKGKSPVLIYIYGGSWYMGEKSLYSKLGDALRDNGFVTVIPNYVQFPFGSLDEMAHDVSEAIRWVYNNIDSYGGDKDNIIVLGHSSGAHITALTLLKNTLGLESITGSDYFVEDMPRIKRAVLLNGPYDFDLLSDELKKTGNKKENSGTKAFLQAALSSKESCPTDILKKYGDKSIKSFGADRIVLMHAEEDATVPVISSYEFLEQIERTSDNPVSLYLTHGYYHCGITEGVMNGDQKAMKILIKGLIGDDLSDDSVIIENDDKEKFVEVDEEEEKDGEEKPQKETNDNSSVNDGNDNGNEGGLFSWLKNIF